MISSLSGVVKVVNSTYVVIDVGGVGLHVSVAPRSTARFAVDSLITLQTVLIVREDSLTLYGFESFADREIFELLQTVTGIGPKVAQSALNLYETPELVSAIAGAHSDALERIPGLGKKGAQRVILELKEKVEHFEFTGILHSGSWREQISSALTGLGFGAREVQDRIEQLSKSYSDVASEPISELLRAALSGAKSE